MIHAACRAGEVAAFHAEAEKLARDYGYDALEPLDRAGIAAHLATEAYHGGVLDRGAAHLHPLNFALGLARAAAAAGVRIFEAQPGEAIGEGAHPEVRDRRGLVRARFVVVAGNGYLGGLVPEIAARVMPINNFIVATAPLGAAAARALIRATSRSPISRFVVNYFRLSADDRLLFGGGESYGYRSRPTSPAWCGRGCSASFPSSPAAPIDHAWGGTLAITVERLPAFRRLRRTSSRRAAIPATAWRSRRWPAS